MTASHLRALELPTTGSAAQLRQCIEGRLQSERDYQSVVVIVHECLKTELVVVLEDSDGEFVETAPLYKDPPAHQLLPLDSGTAAAEVEGVRHQLEEANTAITLTAAKSEEKAQEISNLQEALQKKTEKEQRVCEENSVLEERLRDEKAKARASWRTNCEHLAEQDATITTLEEEVRSLKQQVEALQMRERSRSEAPVSSLSPPDRSGREGTHTMTRREGRRSPFLPHVSTTLFEATSPPHRPSAISHRSDLADVSSDPSTRTVPATTATATTGIAERRGHAPPIE